MDRHQRDLSISIPQHGHRAFMRQCLDLQLLYRVQVDLTLRHGLEHRLTTS